MKNLAVALLSCSIGFAAVDHASHWDGAKYHFNSEEQFQAAKQIVDTLPTKEWYHILDVGCGDGRISAMIQDKLVMGRVWGIDINRSMIEFARQRFPHIGFHFSVRDAMRIDWDEDFDMVVSFSTLQWIPNQEEFLPKVHACLKMGRHFISDTPQGLPAALQKACDTVCKQEQWRTSFEGYAPKWRFWTANEYRSLLEKAGFEVLTCSSRVVPHTFPSKEAFKGFIMQWFPYLSQLENEYQKDAFMRAVIDEYLANVDEEGETVPFPVYRLKVDAIKQ